MLLKSDKSSAHQHNLINIIKKKKKHLSTRRHTFHCLDTSSMWTVLYFVWLREIRNVKISTSFDVCPCVCVVRKPIRKYVFDRNVSDHMRAVNLLHLNTLPVYDEACQTGYYDFTTKYRHLREKKKIIIRQVSIVYLIHR